MYDDKIEDLLECLCDCETYYQCEWHRRLREDVGQGRLTRKEFEEELDWEVTRRHFFYIHGYEIDDEPHPEMLADMQNGEGVQ